MKKLLLPVFVLGTIFAISSVFATQSLPSGSPYSGFGSSPCVLTYTVDFTTYNVVAATAYLYDSATGVVSIADSNVPAQSSPLRSTSFTFNSRPTGNYYVNYEVTYSGGATGMFAPLGSNTLFSHICTPIIMPPFFPPYTPPTNTQQSVSAPGGTIYTSVPAPSVNSASETTLVDKNTNPSTAKKIKKKRVLKWK